MVCENTNWISVSDPDALEQYLVLVYAGLTGSVTMITCTVLALTRLVFEYKGRPTGFHLSSVCVYKHIFVEWFQSGAFSSPDSIEVTTMEQLLHNISLLLTSRTREIVKAALGFIKVILFIMDSKTLASHVTVMVCFVHPGYWSPGIKIFLPSFNRDFTLAFRWRASGISRMTWGGTSEQNWRTSSLNSSGSLGKCYKYLNIKWASFSKVVALRETWWCPNVQFNSNKFSKLLSRCQI